MHRACTARRLRLAVESKTCAGTYPNTPHLHPPLPHTMHLNRAYTPPPSSRPPGDRPFELRSRIPDGVLHYVTPLTPVHFLLRAALVRPDKLAVVHPEQGYHFTYAQWAARVLSLAFALRNVPGWTSGDRVAILSPNVPLIADAHFGVLAAGGVCTPLKYVDALT